MVTGAKTPYDDVEIIAERARQDALPTSLSINTIERDQLRAQVIYELYHLRLEPDETLIWLGRGGGRPASGVKRQRIAVLIIGPPGAGKSTLTLKLAEQMNALVVDSDIIKPKLPEYDHGRGTQGVHDESAFLAIKVFALARQNGDNVILPKVGSNLSQIREIAEQLRRVGYSVHLILNDLNRDDATKRVIARWKNTGRFVDPDFVYNQVGDRPLHCYNGLSAISGLFASTSHYINDTPIGKPPRLASASQNAPRPFPPES